MPITSYTHSNDITLFIWTPRIKGSLCCVASGKVCVSKNEFMPSMAIYMFGNLEDPMALIPMKEYKEKHV